MIHWLLLAAVLQLKKSKKTEMLLKEINDNINSTILDTD